jgi:hypothetical protein
VEAEMLNVFAIICNEERRIQLYSREELRHWHTVIRPKRYRTRSLSSESVDAETKSAISLSC